MLKKTIKLLLLICVLSLPFESYSRNVTVRFKIYAGKCNYSKKTIKSVIKDMGGKQVNYSFKTQMVEFHFDNEEVDILEIHKKLAEAGFQTLAAKPSDHAYKMLPACAQYERK